MLNKIKSVWNALTGKEEQVVVQEPEVQAEAATDAPAEPVVEAPTMPVVAPVAASAGGEVHEDDAELSFQERARHVVAEGDGWAIKAPGKDEALETHAKKKDAIASATAMCKASKGELFIHRKDGKIHSRNSFGNDDPKRKG
jgi:hypothetical protein